MFSCTCTNQKVQLCSEKYTVCSCCCVLESDAVFVNVLICNILWSSAVCYNVNVAKDKLILIFRSYVVIIIIIYETVYLKLWDHQVLLLKLFTVVNKVFIYLCENVCHKCLKEWF